MHSNIHGGHGNIHGGQVGIASTNSHSRRIIMPQSTPYMTVFPFLREIMNYNVSNFNPIVVDNRVSPLDIQAILNDISNDTCNFLILKQIWKRSMICLMVFFFSALIGMIFIIVGSNMAAAFQSPFEKPLFVIGFILFLSNFVITPVLFFLNMRKSLGESARLVHLIQNILNKHNARLSSLGLRMKLPDYPNNISWLELWADYKMAGQGINQGINMNMQPNYQNPQLTNPQGQYQNPDFGYAKPNPVY